MGRTASVAQRVVPRLEDLAVVGPFERRRVVGVASGAGKAQAILGALRGKHVNTLVIDEAAARGVLELYEADPS